MEQHLMIMNNTSHERCCNDSTPNQGFSKPQFFQLVAYFSIIFFSLVGNSLVIAVIYKNANQRMRTPSNYFVVSMAVSDGLITAVNFASLPFSGLKGDVGCKFQKFLWMFLISWSTGSLSAIAVDRFLLVFVPLKRIITLRVARVVIVVIIIIGAVISWPLLILSSLGQHEGKTFCQVNLISSFEALRAYFLLMFVAFIFFPLLILLILYTAIVIKMWLRKSPGNQEARERMNRKIVLMLVTIVVLFLSCWMPVSSLYFDCFARPSGESCSMIRNSKSRFKLWLLAYSNSAINPYIYFIFNENFRHGARMIWSSIRGRCRTCPFNSHNQVHGATVEVIE